MVAAVGDAPSLLEAVAAHNPDIAVVDIRMPPTYTDDGRRAAVELRRTHPHCGVLVLSQYVELSNAENCSQPTTGQSATSSRTVSATSTSSLTPCRPLPPQAPCSTTRLWSSCLPAAEKQTPLELRTRREREVLRLMGEGRSNAGIAEELVLSSGSVEKYISSTFTKLDLLPAAEDHRRVLAVLAWLQAT